MTWKRCRRFERDASDCSPQVGYGAELDADAHRHRQAQPARIHVRLHFMPLLGEVEIGFCSDKDARNVI